jgi:hypothetical protein
LPELGVPRKYFLRSSTAAEAGRLCAHEDNPIRQVATCCDGRLPADPGVRRSVIGNVRISRAYSFVLHGYSMKDA